jgi:4-hydroxy-tetrahydrodipicolinate reductase
LLSRGVAVVSSCERLAWPWYRHPAAGREIDATAKAAGRAVLGTGVNPGFVMDALAVVLSSMVRRVTAVHCERRVDAGLRRQPLQAKVGATMTVEHFAQLKAQEKIGHEGLPESIAMIAAALGRTCEPGSIQVALDPVVAQRPTPSALGLIEVGRVAGIHNVGKWSGDGLSITLDLTMAVGCSEPRDAVRIDGPVQLSLQIPGGVPGDSATVAALINHARAVHTAPAGLRTMLDIAPAPARGRDH